MEDDNFMALKLCQVILPVVVVCTVVEMLKPSKPSFVLFIISCNPEVPKLLCTFAMICTVDGIYLLNIS